MKIDVIGAENLIGLCVYRQNGGVTPIEYILRVGKRVAEIAKEAKTANTTFGVDKECVLKAIYSWLDFFTPVHDEDNWVIGVVKNENKSIIDLHKRFYTTLSNISQAIISKAIDETPLECVSVNSEDPDFDVKEFCYNCDEMLDPGKKTLERLDKEKYEREIHRMYTKMYIKYAACFILLFTVFGSIIFFANRSFRKQREYYATKARESSSYRLGIQRISDGDINYKILPGKLVIQKKVIRPYRYLGRYGYYTVYQVDYDILEEIPIPYYEGHFNENIDRLEKRELELLGKEAGSF